MHSVWNTFWIKANKEAELKRVEARGIADAQNILSSALTDKVLQYEMIKAQRELANSQNSKIIIMGGGKIAPYSRKRQVMSFTNYSFFPVHFWRF